MGRVDVGGVINKIPGAGTRSEHIPVAASESHQRAPEPEQSMVASAALSAGTRAEHRLVAASVEQLINYIRINTIRNPRQQRHARTGDHQDWVVISVEQIGLQENQHR